MRAIEIKKDIYWVGAVDWELRNFHGYLTQRGSTYNAYLIMDEKITLVDTVKPGALLTSQLMKRISEVVDPDKIDYVVSNHTEMDHSGFLPEMMKIAKNAELVVSPNGEKGLKAHYKTDFNFKVVKSGDSLDLGKRTLQFHLTPMVHWPDNMINYIPEDKLLLTNDSFGQHYASSERFDDECSLDIVMDEARKYYANIVLPYGKQVRKELDAAKGLDFDMIAPSHGVIWRKHVKEIVEQYERWVNNETQKKAVIVYDTMWRSTEYMAYAIMEAFEEAGYYPVMRNLQHNHISDIMTDFQETEYLCVGSPTLNKNLMPNVAAFLTYLRGLSPGGRKAIAFGSFGWGGQAIDQVEQYLKECDLELVHSYKQKYIPDNNDCNELKEEVKKIVSG